MAFDQLDHLPDPWWIGAQICQVIAATMGGKKTDVYDWMPLSKRPVKIMSGETGKVIIQAIIAGSKVKVGDDLPNGERLD